MNNTLGIILMIIVTLLNAAAQFLLKKGVNGFFNLYLLFGLLFYMFSALLLIIALKHGKLNVLYPIVSLTFIWVAVISVLFLSEEITYVQAGGIGSILMGVIFITKGDAL